jgi:predicted glutamine amidotransferase
MARVTKSDALLATVRCATAGTAPGPASVAPFASGGWLFSHNGRIDGWPDGQVIAATAAGDTLWCWSDDAGTSGASGPAVIVASEPGDDEPGWTAVPDGSVVTAAPGRVSVAAPDTQAIHHQTT